MYIIEPCCAVRQLMQLRDAIGTDGTKEFKGYGDLSLTELLPAILARYSETDMLIVAPTMPDQAVEVITKWMNQQWPRRDGRGKLDTIHRLTIIADLSKKKSPIASAWIKDSPWGERLTLVNQKQADTAILLPDFAITGPVNMRYGDEFVATATTDPERISNLWKQYAKVEETKETEEEPAADIEEVAQEPAAETTGTVSEKAGLDE